jgi:prepilin-type N-terminal cleavage/methylation domain-containing protein/prepilin-type processing-associated H-X9-DG protein
MNTALRPSQDRAFTVIELLVVIAIIALLIGILLPGLAGARQAARSVKCLSNQRQIGMALQMYASMYNEYIPRECGFSEDPSTPLARRAPAWPFVLRPLLDPNAPVVSPRVDLNGGVGDLFARAEYYRDPARRPDRHNIHYVNNGISFRSPGVVNVHAKRPTQLFKHPSLSDVLYLACFTDDRSSVHANNVYHGSATDKSVAMFYDMHHIENVTGTMPNSPTHSQRIAPRRHGRSANAVFLDGHARAVSERELTDISRWDDRDYRRFDAPWMPPP